MQSARARKALRCSSRRSRTAPSAALQQPSSRQTAIKAALIAGDEAHSCGLRLGYNPGILASSQVASYVAWKLGRTKGS